MNQKFEGTSRLHLALNTQKMDQSIEFYTALFNVAPSKVKPGYAKFEVAQPPLNLTLNESTQVTGNRINHLGIEVKSGGGVQDQLARLKKLGLDTSIEEDTTCCYAKQDKVWVTDPDGNAWETFFVFEDSEVRNDTDSTCCLSPNKTCTTQ